MSQGSLEAHSWKSHQWGVKFVTWLENVRARPPMLCAQK